MDKWNNVFNTLNLKVGKKALVGFLMMIFMGISGVVFASSASAINYTIEYKENVATNMPESVLGGLSPTASALLSNNSPLRAGFQFLGWCDQATTKIGGTDTCVSGHQHQPGGTVTLDATANANSIKLYAMWAEICPGKTTMQGLTSSSIASLLPNIGSTATVCDVRDNQDYVVAKLADGKYWMVENLNLAGGTALSADDTDVTSAYISSFSTSNNLTKTGDAIALPASSTSGFNTDNYSYVYNSGNKTSNCSSPGCYSYYSWDVATLGSGRSISTDNTDAPYSICPKGWHLPNTYNGSGTAAEATDFRALMIALGGSNSVQTYDSSTTPTGATISSALQANPVGFLLAGYYYNGSFYLGGSLGYYWSSTSYSNTSTARNLLFNSSFVYSVRSSYRYNGFSVRCVFGS